MNGNGRYKLEDLYRPLMCRGVRGATTVTENTSEAILSAARELLETIVRLNDMQPDDIASVYFTTTADLNSAYPALAARQMGWFHVPLLCGHEMNVPDGLPLCLRVLIHWNSIRRPQEVVHVYLHEARSLRPDRKDLPPIRPIQMPEMEAAARVLEGSW
jgi:chorismate mutase